MSSREQVTVTGDNIESFIDAVVEAAKEGYERVDTMELSMGVLTNYWRCTMMREVPQEDSVEEANKTATRGRPAKKE
jgi:hypothetical protein